MSDTLVICDDDSVARRVIEGVANQAGFDVVGEAELAVQAIDLVRFHQPAVVVMDVAMPGMSGTEALSAIHAESPDTRVVLVSAFDVLVDVDVDPQPHAVIDKSELEQLGDVLVDLAEATSA